MTQFAYPQLSSFLNAGERNISCRTECTKFSHKRVGNKGALEQSDGQELDQELNLDPKRIAARQPSELKMGFPSFEQHFDPPPTTVFLEVTG